MRVAVCASWSRLPARWGISAMSPRRLSLAVAWARRRRGLAACERASQRRFRLRPPAPFHGLVDGVPIADIEKCTATMKSRQVREFLSFFWGREHSVHCCLDPLRNRTMLACCLALEPSHDGVINVRSHCHVANHTGDTALCQPKTHRLTPCLATHLPSVLSVLWLTWRVISERSKQVIRST